jgi:hypothetical protein
VSLPRNLVSDSVKFLQPFTDNGIVSCHQGKHHKLKGKFGGRKWVFVIPCSPKPYYPQKLHSIKLEKFICGLKEWDNLNNHFPFRGINH